MSYAADHHVRSHCRSNASAVSVLLLALQLAPLGCLATTDAERLAFKGAYAAASRGQETLARTAAAALGEYPLVPYLQYAWLRNGLGLKDRAEVEAFIRDQSELPITSFLHRRWINVLGRNRKWDWLNAIFDDAVADTEGHCFYLQAQMADGWMPRLDDVTDDLWLAGESRPKSCDPVFTYWRRSGELAPGLILDRIELAVARGNWSLAQFLSGRLSGESRALAEQMIRTARYPATQLPRLVAPVHPRLHQQSVEAMLRFARRDNEQAIELWPRVRDVMIAASPQVERELALYRATDYEPDARALLASVDRTVRDAQIVQWQIRLAVAAEDWLAVRRAFESTTDDSLTDSRWRYWYARSLSELGASEAEAHWQSLASEAHYHGFLAADALDQPYRICPARDYPDPAERARLAALPGIVRALELFQVGQTVHARREWQAASSGLSDAERRALAMVAAAVSWDHQAILTLAGAGAMNDYAQRFPSTHARQASREGKRFDVDSTIALAVMRAESALAADAVSSANAIGLMQLTLPTARAVARRNSLTRPSRSDLLKPQRNIELGVAHLAELFEEYRHPLKVMAAYNAGPEVLERWTSEARLPNEGVRWVEALPYYETRDYIPRVLAYQVIYQWLGGGDVTRISAYHGPLDGPSVPDASSPTTAVECPS